MALDSFGRPTYNDVIDAIMQDVVEPEITPKLVPGILKTWILQACQKICDILPVRETRALLLIQGQEDFGFKDSTEPVTGTGNIGTSGINVTGTTSAGTGTISTSGVTVTGVGTLFITELALGKAIVVGTDVKEVLAINSNTSATIASAFTTDLSASAFTVTTTKFGRELVLGSIIVSSGQSKTIASITDARTATVTESFTPDLVAQTFTVDTVVTQVPVRFHRITAIDRKENTLPRRVEVCGITELLRRRVYDQNLAYSNFFRPAQAAEWRDASGQRFLKVYPTAEVHKSVTLYAEIRIQPRFYSSAALTAAIPIAETFEPLIRASVKARIYQVYGKNFDMARAYSDEFTRLAGLQMDNVPNVNRMTMEYK